MRTPAPDRFWAKVEKTDSCWLWRGAHTGTGYGNFMIEKGRDVPAHRFAYEELVGPIPSGLMIDHLCRVRGCVNPAHMDVVTNQENARRGARGQLVTHCPHGHELTAQNTHIRRDGRRRCRRCMEEKLALYMATKARSKS